MASDGKFVQSTGSFAGSTEAKGSRFHEKLVHSIGNAVSTERSPLSITKSTNPKPLEPPHENQITGPESKSPSITILHHRRPVEEGFRRRRTRKNPQWNGPTSSCGKKRNPICRLPVANAQERLKRIWPTDPRQREQTPEARQRIDQSASPQSAALSPHNAHRYPSQHPRSQTTRTSTRKSNYGTGIKITFYNHPSPLPACGRRVWAGRRTENQR